MKCPHCQTETKLMGYECSTHLSGGISIGWCPECGTTFRYYDFNNRVTDVQIPKREKANENTSSVKEDQASRS